MKLNSVLIKENKKRAAFTLIEMIGVLAVIAILAAMLIPRVFSAIADSKINNTVVSAESIKTALADHYGKFGKFDAIYGTNTAAFATLPMTNYDQQVLIPEGLIDKVFQTKLGTWWSIQLRACGAAGNVTAAATDPGYSLDGNGTNNALGQYVLEAIIGGVAEADAQAISSRIDGSPTANAGTSLTAGTLGNADTLGRVKYAAPASAGAPVTVYVYLTHR